MWVHISYLRVVAFFVLFLSQGAEKSVGFCIQEMFYAPKYQLLPARFDYARRKPAI
jgi:hypothetical protein